MGRDGGDRPWERPLPEQVAALRHDMAPFRTIVDEVLREQKSIDRRVKVLERVTSDLHRWADEVRIADLSSEERAAYADMVRWWRRRGEKATEEMQEHAAFQRRVATIATVVGAIYTLLLIAVAILALRK